MSLFGKKPKVSTTKPQNRLDPQQQTIENVLTGVLQKGPEAAAQPFQGPFAAPLSPLEQTSLAALEQRAMNLAGGNTGVIGQGEQALSQVLQGGPQDFEDFYRETVFKPLQKEFSEIVLPTVTAQFARGAGSSYGSDRLRAVTRATEDFTNTLARERAQLAFDTANQAEQRRLQALGLLPSVAGAQTNELLSLLSAGAVPRAVSQADVTGRYQEFVRAQDQQNQRIAQMLSFLGIPTQEINTVVRPGSEGILGPSTVSAGLLALGGIFSSREFKEPGEPIDFEKALAAVRKMPVEKWKYKKGIDDESEHIGTYAEDFHRALGLPEKQFIHTADAFGAALAAIKALDKKVSKMQKKRAA